MKCEGSRKFLVLRPCYVPAVTTVVAAAASKSPTVEDNLLNSSDVSLMSPGSRQAFSLSEHDNSVTSFSAIDNSGGIGSPFRGDPPPYKPPPEVQKLRVIESETKEQYRECVDEFKSALSAFDKRNGVVDDNVKSDVSDVVPPPPVIPPRKRNSSSASADAMMAASVAASNRMEVVVDKENAENVPPPQQDDKVASSRTNTLEKQISVKEATKKFNLIASEEEANKLITSPPAKKKPEKVSAVFFLHMEWIWNLKLKLVIHLLS